MNRVYLDEELVRNATYKDFKKTILAISVTMMLFLLVFLNMGIPFSTKYTIPELFTTSRSPSQTNTVDFISSIANYASNPNRPYLLFLFVLSITVSIIFGVSETLSAKNKPKNLAQIITNTYLVMKATEDESRERLRFRIEDGALEIRWHTNAGSVHNWKLLLTLFVPKTTNSNVLIKLPDLLLMNEVDQANESHPENKMYQKTIFVREWPRQEYIIHHWLKSME